MARGGAGGLWLKRFALQAASPLCGQAQDQETRKTAVADPEFDQGWGQDGNGPAVLRSFQGSLTKKS